MLSGPFVMRTRACEFFWFSPAHATRFCSTLVFLTGVFILVVGGCATSVDPGPHAIAAPPVFVIYSGIPIATGCLCIVTGLVGIVIGILPSRPLHTVIIIYLTILNVLWQV